MSTQLNSEDPSSSFIWYGTIAHWEMHNVINGNHQIDLWNHGIDQLCTRNGTLWLSLNQWNQSKWHCNVILINKLFVERYATCQHMGYIFGTAVAQKYALAKYHQQQQEIQILW